MKNTEKTAGSPPQQWFEAVMIDIEKIKASPTNPRKHFSADCQKEIENSIRVHGFTLSVLVVRPVQDTYYIEADEATGLFNLCRKKADGEVESLTFKTRKEADAQLQAASYNFELVTGERRWRAAKAVGLKEVPCIISMLNDNECLEIQLVENVQREDLTPIEEADGYQRILSLRDGAGKPIHTVESLAEKVGKSTDTVRLRLKLCNLDAEARKAVESGILPPNTAILIARIPDEKLRAKATKGILKPKYEEGPLSLRKAKELVQREFMKDLREAPFDQADAELLPVEMDEMGDRCAGGACADCPFKVGNAAALCDEAVVKQQHNNCLNPICYERKRELGWKAWMESETDLLKKRHALTESECRKIYNFGDQRSWNCGYVDLSEHPDGNDLKAGVESPGTWRSLVKGTELEIVVARDRNGRKHELVNRELAIEAASTINEHKIFKKPQKDKLENDEENKTRALKEQRERELKQRLASATVSELVMAAQAIKKTPIGFWRLFAAGVLQLADYGGAVNVTSSRRGCSETESGYEFLTAKLKEMTDGEVIALMLEILLVAEVPDEYNNRGNYNDSKKKWWAAWGKLLEVDLKAAEKRVKAEIVAEEKAKADAEKQVAAGELPWTTFKEAPSDDEIVWCWNAHGVCETPDQVKLPLKDKKFNASVEVAPLGLQWVYGMHCSGPQGRCGGPVTKTGTKYSSRALALKTGLLDVLSQLKQHKAQAALMKLVQGWIDGISAPKEEKPGKKVKGKLDAAGRAKIVAAIKVRWSKKNGGSK